MAKKIEVFDSEGSYRDTFEQAKTAVRELGFNIDVEYVTDSMRVLKAGGSPLPIISIDGRVVSSGKTLSAEDIKGIILWM
ncbi:MAG: thioredoxin family protein [Candidatus Pacebacteria bacterium]|nr:thioredoxin family protein [Candidatus Paceibacterota bacterium]MDD3919330.1 thioredoxin family protein [Candidatus Paceibacterota bacterium]